VKQAARQFANALIVVLVVTLQQSAAQTSPEVASEMTASTLRQDWRAVADFAAAQPLLSSPERLLAAHAQLALNRSNEALAGFLSFTEEGPLRQWKDWTAKLRSEHPSNPVACYLHGDALARLREWPAAMDAFDAGLKLDPQNAMLLHARGVSHAANWQLDLALVDLTMATRSKTDFAEAYASLGSTWVQRQSGGTGALRAFNKAIELAPDSAAALHSRGGLRMVQADLEGAKTDLESALNMAGPVQTAAAAKTRELLDLLRQREQREADTVLAGGEPVGVPINRMLQGLERNETADIGGTIDKLGALVDRFPEHRQPVVERIAQLAKANSELAQQISSHLSRRDGVSSMITALAENVALRSLPAAGLQYASAIGLRESIRPSQTTQAASSSLSASASLASRPGYLRTDFSDSRFARALSEPGFTTRVRVGAANFERLDATAKWLSVLDKGLSYGLRTTTSFGAASMRDWADLREGRYSFARSYSLETAGVHGLEGIGLLANHLNSTGRFPARLNFSGTKEVVRGLTSQIARGSILPNGYELVDYTSGALKFGVGAITAGRPLLTPPGLYLENRIDTTANLTRELWRTQEFGRDAIQRQLSTLNRSRVALGLPPITVHQLLTGTQQYQLGMYSGPFGDRILNWIGLDSNWIGRNKSGGEFSFLLDARGQYPLGDTTVPGKNWRDWTARTHDIQYWADLHLDKGQWLEVTGPKGKSEFFRSRGSVFWTNVGVVAANLVGTFFPIFRPFASSSGVRYTRPEGQIVKAEDIPGLQQTKAPSQPESKHFLRDLKPNLAPMKTPGGFRTGSELPFWQDGEWPITPWYGLAYVISESPTRTENEEKQQ
jgi:tetratricopeptide (TPR) repeat protein